ncbi:MAG: MFS transporter [Pseudomonadota bacterium]|jgi:predicted MFS family arabinose efflux permease
MLRSDAAQAQIVGDRSFGLMTAAIAAGVFVIGSGAFAIPVILRDLTATFQVQPDSAGLAISTYGLALAVSTLLLGGFSDRTSRRTVILCGLTLFTCGLSACAFASVFLVFVGGQAVCGIGAGLYLPAAYSYIGDNVPYEQRARAMGRVMAGWSLSLLLGVSGGALVGEYTGWRGTLAIVALMGLVALLVLTRLPPAAGADLSRPRDRHVLPELRDSTLRSLRTKGVLPLMAVHFLAMSAFYGMFTYLATHLRSILSIGVGATGLFIIAYGVGFSLSTLNGRIIDQIGKIRCLSAALLGPAVVMAILPQLGPIVPMIVVLLFLWGTLQAVDLTTTLTVAGQLSTSLRGQISSLVTSAGYFGMTVGSALAGRLFAYNGYEAVGFVCGGSALAAFIVLIVAFMRTASAAGPR